MGKSLFIIYILSAISRETCSFQERLPNKISNARILNHAEIKSSTLQDTTVEDVKEAIKSARAANGKNKYSEAIPFLERPPLLNGELAGDFGFDPLRLSTNRERLYYFREAEIKHARLAMLAAAGWPISERFDESIASILNMSPAVDMTTHRVPSVLNGGLEKISPQFWGFCLGLSAAIDLYGIRRARLLSNDESYIPGDLNFDPFGLYPASFDEKKEMQLKEIKHGRVAMIAVVAFALQEAIGSEGVINETPFFFFPLQFN